MPSLTERLSAHDVTADDVLYLIDTRQIELNELEYKRSGDSDKDILKAACAISNAGGGFILLGIAEDVNHCAQSIVDVERPQATADGIRQKLRDGLSPRPFMEVVPLAIKNENIIVIRISPQNPPHMISAEKKTDFYSRYDATSERMRYEEIEQKFRDKISQEQSPSSIKSGSLAVLETLSGRQRVSSDAAAALEQYVETFRTAGQPVLGIIAVQEDASTVVSSEIADWVFLSPTYARYGGWIVIHPSLPVTPLGGRWQQDYGESARTYLNSSTDFVFQKAIDEVLCWRQREEDFVRRPRLYSNALIEYCLSFVYSLSDLIARTRPRRVLIKGILISGPSGVDLPLGEGGSVWYDTPASPPAIMTGASITVPLLIDANGPVHVRREAFRLASQIYAFFGYAESKVPFSSHSVITFESATNESKILMVRSYLQGRLAIPVRYTGEDFERDIHWFRFKVEKGSQEGEIGFTDEFLEDFAIDEDRFFGSVDAEDINKFIEEIPQFYRPVMTSEGLKAIRV